MIFLRKNMHQAGFETARQGHQQSAALHCTISLSGNQPYSPPPPQQTQTNRMSFVQRRSNVFDVSPTLYKCYTNVFCLLGLSFSPGDVHVCVLTCTQTKTIT